MSFVKRFGKSSGFQSTVAFIAASYIKLVHVTGRFTIYGRHVPERFWQDGESFICATWHGQNMMTPPFWHNWRELSILASRSSDGEIIARVMHRFGLSTIRGAGVPKGAEKKAKHKDKGGASALRGMVRALRNEVSVGMTADLPPGPARKAGEGIVALARLSGKPIVPVAVTTRARVVLNNWDRYQINLPFSKGAFVWGDPIYVPGDASGAALEEARRKVEEALNAVTAEADALVGRPGNAPAPHPSGSQA